MGMKAKNIRRWTEAEDELLRVAVSKYGKHGDVNWHEVASYIENRNNKDCRKRWIYTLEPSINKGCWNQQEDDLLMKGIQMHGFQWVLVSQVIGTRQPDQCSRRWHQSLNPNIKYGRWSLAEDQTLKQAVQIHGRKWTEIVDRYFPDRTPIAAKKRYTVRFEPRISTSSSKDFSRLADGETIKSPENLTQAENERTKSQEPVPAVISRIPNPSQGQCDQNFSTGGGMQRAAATNPYKSNPRSTLPIINDLFDTNNSDLTFAQTAAMMDSSSAIRNLKYSTSNTYSSSSTPIHHSSMSSSPFTLSEVFDEKDSLSLTSDLSSFPQSADISGHRVSPVEQLFPDIDLGDGFFFDQGSAQALLQGSDAPPQPRPMSNQQQPYFFARQQFLQQAAIQPQIPPAGTNGRHLGPQDAALAMFR